jgi:spermidine synthase
VFASLVACALLVACAAPAADTFSNRTILAQEKSPFALITVAEANGKRTISIGGQEQSAVDLADKRQWVYSYTYLLSLAVLARAPNATREPVRCLMVGLGGGSFADFLAETFPDWHIRIVEIDPVVIKLARRYFPIHPRIEIVQADGRAYLQKSAEKYDIIVMDAFGENFIPPDLYTLEYFQLMKSRLSRKGLVLMNAWENDLLDVHELATLGSVFARGYYLHHPQEHPGNRIYFMADDLAPAAAVKKRIAEGFNKYRFPGQNPRPVLDSMQNLHATAQSAAIITDANVRAFLQRLAASE